jgi:hypothetical protein
MPETTTAPPAPPATPPAPASAAPPAPPKPSASPEPPERKGPDAWAQQKGTPAWQLAAARARRLSTPTHPQRAAWLPNGQLTEADFDATLTETLNGRLR